ncbi:unnamed protein product [Fusarium fujikuroi]|uniref:Xylanolytic transcriptional activator regulatory domain-containing protein n=1 Tax=Fusarium fujikuroi TaxID=5127 RepID=A0A9Q9UCB6_FUSFU|nr:unnamed protein product [Fusarium fujikuroi]
MATSIQPPRQRRFIKIRSFRACVEYLESSQQDGAVSPPTKFNVLPVTSAGHVIYMGESAGFNLLLSGSQGPVVHFPLPRDTLALSIPAGLDPLETRILQRRGAFVLPPKTLCDDLIETFFAWVHPIVPVVNRTKFMSQYRDPKSPPSMLLIQSILLAGARISTNPQLMVDGSASTAVATFYRRAKALYDADYERDGITLVQSMLLMGWYWAGPDDISKNMFYWSQSAIAVAQNLGLHRSMENSTLSISEKRLRKRIWWTLFTRDRTLAVGLGQSVSLNLDDCDVDMIADDDFIEHDGNDIHEYPPDPTQVGFFVQYVKLCKLIGLVASKYSNISSGGQDWDGINSIATSLSKWNQECPAPMRWERSKHHFWSGILYLHYFSACCLLHRASSPRNRKTLQDTKQSYGLRDGTVGSANMITSIVEALRDKQQLRRCPPFIVHSLFSAVVIHLHVSNTPSPTTRRLARRRVSTCLESLKDLAQVCDGKPSSRKGEVVIDLGCADTSDQACSPDSRSITTDVSDKTQALHDPPGSYQTLPYREAYTPVVVDSHTEFPTAYDYPSNFDLGVLPAQIDSSSLLPDAYIHSGLPPGSFYVDDTAQICNPITDASVPSWDQFQMGCQQDYSISVPWSLIPDPPIFL